MELSLEEWIGIVAGGGGVIVVVTLLRYYGYRSRRNGE